MKALAWLSIVAIALAPLPVQGQETNQTEPELPRLIETVDVRVINIDVVVTDRRGNAITGLTKDDFILYENGRPQPITNFYEVVTRTDSAEPQVRTAEAPRPAEPERPQQLSRKIVIFVDNLSLAPFNRNRVFEAMKEFTRETLRPGDEAMIVTWNRSLNTRLPFTSDAKQIEQVLDAIAGESALGIQQMSERRQAQSRIREARTMQEAIVTARTYAQSLEHDLRTTTSAINSLTSTLGGVEGKKIMLITSEGFWMQPGIELFHYIDDQAREHADWTGQGSTFLESMHFNSARLIESIGRAANANDITLYTLHAGGLVGYNQSSAEHREPISPNVQHVALSNSTDSLRLMADLTGGIAVVGTNNFDAAFERIRQDISSYYSLGYRSGTERVDRQRSLEVKTKNPAYIVRARKSFIEKSITTEMTDKVIANLFYESSSNDMRTLMRTGQPRRQENGLFLVPVEIIVPMESLTLLPRGEIYTGSFSIYVVASNEHGDMSEVQRQQQSVRVPAAEFPNIKGKHFTYAIDLLMEPGRGTISIGVLDDVSNQTGFTMMDLLVRDLR
ncbi:MAG: VWA domain-containing protein [Thermoanaerobaculia bacterium]